MILGPFKSDQSSALTSICFKTILALSDCPEQKNTETRQVASQDITSQNVTKKTSLVVSNNNLPVIIRHQSK